MSRIGKMPVSIISGVTVELTVTGVIVKGPKGTLSFDFPAGISASQEGDLLTIERSGEEKQTRAFHGLTRATIANMVEGVSKGYEKKLEIIGVGYRANIAGKKLNLTLGFSHPVEMEAPEGIDISMDPDAKNIIVISGIDKQSVGEFAANIRKLRKPEPYKGKGIRYTDEYIRRKAGKSAAK